MDHPVYRFTFSSDVSMDEVEATLVLAFFSAEALHGEAQVRLDGRHTLDAASRQCVIEAGTEVGRTVCRLFTSYLRRELRDEQFQAERLREPLAA